MTNKRYATLEQHEALRQEVDRQGLALDRLAVRVEVISHDTTRILSEFADLREDLVEFQDSVDARFRAVDLRFDALEGRFDALEGRFTGHEKLLNAILSAVLELSKQR